MSTKEVNSNKASNCPRCDKKFVCRPDNISECDCSKIDLTPEEYRYISSKFTLCVCNNCLKDLKSEYNTHFHFNRPDNSNPRNFGLGFVFFLLALFSNAQVYAPPVGQSGTTAMHKDSSVFINWASTCVLNRAYQDISTPSLGLTTVGDSSMATGKAQANGVVSLGDGGSAICTFAYPIMDGPGNDFAVFENSIDDTFLELAFVEVSSDGVNYVRFPAHSLTDTLNQTGSFGSTNATKINNLAGKYRAGYGTPFDLQELTGKAGLDITRITHVKIVDVVGSLNDAYASRDFYKNKVNDPWPTPFPSSGFDLDAVGVIHENKITGIRENTLKESLSFYPNPVKQSETICVGAEVQTESLELLDSTGKSVLITTEKNISTIALIPGIYFVKIKTPASVFLSKLVVL